MAELDDDGVPYYWNERLRAASWTRPVVSEAGMSAPTGWVAYVEDESGVEYFYNERERTTTWTRPEGSVSVSRASLLLSSRI